MNEDIKPCPFCGEVPDSDHIGTYIEITCCVVMDMQKCDYLTNEQRDTWSCDTYTYSEEAEAICAKELISRWNTRA